LPIIRSSQGCLHAEFSELRFLADELLPFVAQDGALSARKQVEGYGIRDQICKLQQYQRRDEDPKRHPRVKLEDEPSCGEQEKHPLSAPLHKVILLWHGARQLGLVVPRHPRTTARPGAMLGLGPHKCVHRLFPWHCAFHIQVLIGVFDLDADRDTGRPLPWRATEDITTHSVVSVVER